MCPNYPEYLMNVALELIKFLVIVCLLLLEYSAPIAYLP